MVIESRGGSLMLKKRWGAPKRYGPAHNIFWRGCGSAPNLSQRSEPGEWTAVKRFGSQGARGQFPWARISGNLQQMFVIELVYKVDLSQIDAHMSAHVAFLKKYY